MNHEELLKQVGLDEKEARVYLAILELGSGTITPIARRSGVKRTSIYYFIDRLVELGLIEQVKLRGRMHYKALSPKRLVELEESRLAAVKSALPEFLSAFNAVEGKPRISYYEGPSQVRNIMLEENRCHKEARYIWSGSIAMEMVGGKRFMEALDKSRKANGTFIRVVKFRGLNQPFEGSGSGADQLRETRFGPEALAVPVTIGIYDTGKVGIISSKKEGFGLMIESAEIVATMSMFWGLLWERSEPASQGEG